MDVIHFVGDPLGLEVAVEEGVQTVRIEAGGRVRGRRAAAALGSAVLLAACGACGEEESGRTAAVAETAETVDREAGREPGERLISDGYTILYSAVTKQQLSDELLLAKLESDPVDAVITDVAHTAGEYVDRLEEMAEAYPAIDLDSFSPVLRKMRASIGEEQRGELLGATGVDFERKLLRAQSDATGQLRHLAGAMVALETSAERRAFWEDVEQRYGALHRRLEELLRERHFRSE